MGNGRVRIRLEPGALAGFLVLWALVSLASEIWLFDRLWPALVFGFFSSLLHYLSLLVHHLSHSVAARRTGYPMAAVNMGRLLVLGTSVYPSDEGEVPGRIHIQRAIGGPIGSTALALLAGGLAFLLPRGSSFRWLASFLALDSFVIFVLGVFLPLGFTDINTILGWWGR